MHGTISDTWNGTSIWGKGVDRWIPQLYLAPCLGGTTGNQEEDWWDWDAIAWGAKDQPNAANAPAPGGGKPTGLGLLLAGGYLTQQGASVLNCPSRRLADPESTQEPFYSALGASGSNTEITAINHCATFDADEPFYTSGGLVKWSDGDGIGDGYGGYSGSGLMQRFGVPAPAMQSPDVPFWWYGANVERPDGQRYSADGHGPNNPCDGNYSGGGGTDYGYQGRYCAIFGAYQVRNDSVDDYTWCSWRLDEINGQAVASDAIWGFFIRPRSVPNYPAVLYDPAVADSLQHQWFLENHDKAYNVLFTDGSVKTFSDAGLSLYKTMVVIQGQGAASAGQPPYLIGRQVWETFFDALYAQD